MKLKMTFLLIVQCTAFQLMSQGTHPYVSLSNSTEAVVQRYYQLSENEKYDELMTIFTDSTTLIDYNAQEIPGYVGRWKGQEIIDMMKQVSGNISYRKETIIASFVSGSYLTLFFEMEYTQSPKKDGDKAIRHKAQGVKVFYVVQGKIVKIDEYLDYLALLKQSSGG